MPLPAAVVIRRKIRKLRRGTEGLAESRTVQTVDADAGDRLEKAIEDALGASGGGA